jgi:hypothetical protein
VSDNKKVISVEVDGKELKLAVKKPDHKTKQKGELVFGKAFRDAVKNGFILKVAVEQELRTQNLWNDSLQAEYDKVVARILQNELRLTEGGFKLSEAKEVAIQMRKDRYELMRLKADRDDLEQKTAEAYAEQARFNFLVSACTVYADTGKPYYRDCDDFMSREDDPVSTPAASALGRLIYGLDDDYKQKMPENKFLIKYGFCNEKLHLVDKQGRLVDEKGRLMDDKGRFINEKGELVDTDGHILTESGEYKVEFKGFTEDDGTPIAEGGKKPAHIDGGEPKK